MAYNITEPNFKSNQIMLHVVLLFKSYNRHVSGIYTFIITYRNAINDHPDFI